jgi:hypothetical protein
MTIRAGSASFSTISLPGYINLLQAVSHTHVNILIRQLVVAHLSPHLAAAAIRAEEISRIWQNKETITLITKVFIGYLHCLPSFSRLHSGSSVYIRITQLLQCRRVSVHSISRYAENVNNPAMTRHVECTGKNSCRIIWKFFSIVFFPLTTSPCPGTRYSMSSLASRAMDSASVWLFPPGRSVRPTPR